MIKQTLAETGQGDDVFRVIMTIFGVDKSKGDVVAIVTVNNGEASKVRFLDLTQLQAEVLLSMWRHFQMSL